MTMFDLFGWLEATPLATWMNTTQWLYPTVLTAHGLGMAMVVGVTVVTGLRILGFPSGIPLGAYRQLLPYLIAAFVVNAVSGVILFCPDAGALAHNPSFQIKVVSLILGVIVLWRTYSTVIWPAAAAERAGIPDSEFVLPKSAKALAVASIVLWWLSVIVSGRLVAYLAKVA
jgi:hypothetical protein